MTVLHPKNVNLKSGEGFTLFEVLITVTVLALGISIGISVISGSLGNVRKAQAWIRLADHANTVMELALLDDSIKGAATFNGDFAEDGTRWTLNVEEYTPDFGANVPSSSLNMSVKMLQYTVDMFYPRSGTASYRLQTLKIVSDDTNMPAGAVLVR